MAGQLDVFKPRPRLRIDELDRLFVAARAGQMESATILVFRPSPS
jgi:hypothetical protein